MFPPDHKLLVGDLIFIANPVHISELAGLNPAQDGSPWFAGDLGDLGYPQVGFHRCK